MNKPIERIEADQHAAANRQAEEHAEFVAYMAHDADRKQRVAEIEKAKIAREGRIEKRRERVAKYYLQGLSIRQIANAIDIPCSAIVADLAAVREEWRVSRIGFMDRAKSEQLEKLDQIESEASEAWEKSKKPTRIITETKNSKGKVTTRTEIREATGDPQFLKQRNDCIARRCKLLGLDAPVKSESSVTATVTHYQPPDSRQVVAEKIREAVNRLRQPSADVASG